MFKAKVYPGTGKIEKTVSQSRGDVLLRLSNGACVNVKQNQAAMDLLSRMKTDDDPVELYVSDKEDFMDFICAMLNVPYLG